MPIHAPPLESGLEHLLERVEIFYSEAVGPIAVHTYHFCFVYVL